MKKTNLKDIVSTICGYILVISGAVLVLPTAGVALPTLVTGIAMASGTLAGGIIGILTGKNADGSVKIIPPTKK